MHGNAMENMYAEILDSTEVYWYTVCFS